MAKFHYVQRNFHESFAQTTATAPQGPLTQIATRTTSDTYVRSYHEPRIVTEIDPSVSPPQSNWWNGVRAVFSVRFDKSGSSGTGSGPFLASTIGTLDLYPRYVGDTALNGLQYVIFEPIGGPLKLVTARKGDGVNFPRIVTSMWNTDHNGVFQNPGGIFSVKHSITWTSTIIWASDSP